SQSETIEREARTGGFRPVFGEGRNDFRRDLLLRKGFALKLTAPSRAEAAVSRLQNAIHASP
ncbi:MAG: hypothetical protein FWC70_08500, partial [Defluviitaleaceae bacterium]|nr:hypothetical protein [Defluviitaleaceae bacterium]